MQISWCPTDRINDLQAFIDTHWLHGHILARNSELLSWQYRNFNDPDNISVLIAQENEKILGFLGCLQRDFCYKGHRIPAIWLAMWMVTPEAKTRFVGLKLLNKVNRDQYNIVATLGLNENTGSIFPNRGFEIYEPIPRWIRIINLNELDKILIKHPKGYPQKARQEWRKTIETAPIKITTNIRLVDWNEDIAHQWDQVWRERFALKILGTWRDSTFLKWRYVNHPCFKYSLRFAKDETNGSLMGLAVFRIETVQDSNERILRIVEFLSEKSATEVLTKDIIDTGQALNVAFTDFYCTSEIFAKPLEMAGFKREDHMSAHLPRLFQPLDFSRSCLNGAFWVNPKLSDNCHQFFRTQPFYVTSSDADQDRPN